MSRAESKVLSEGQRAYEARRAAKAGLSLDRWLESKQKSEQAAQRERDKTTSKPARKPGLISRLLDRAHRPI